MVEKSLIPVDSQGTEYLRRFCKGNWAWVHPDTCANCPIEIKQKNRRDLCGV